ncbi:Prostaglandin reductase 3 [Phytophthora pseudosyringae]|uniref:Prostaglandin reductase 3 n=1 Tax=Phytophthora pseudosyringae TaxID=221518 RepID=A0A8T1WJD1_9STRA|nr:Prostaglandin reductase 3 [Phytophthora pseudosyringae]
MKVSTSVSASLTVLATVIPAAQGMFRFDCFNNLVVDRVDPIVNPGEASGHVHAISGGNGFSKNADGAAMKASTCTSCPIGADLSAYWVPQMYVKFKNGTGYGLVESHQIVYYEPRPTGDEKVIAFPDGLKMLAGNPKLREKGDSIEEKAVTWVCLDYDNAHPEQQGIPNFKCPNGLRGQVNFPMCWDGENLDSADHKSHVAYATALDGGSCPDGWKKMVKIFYEAFYNVAQYDDEWDGNQHPFVLANGDRTGFGFHGDFLNGWDVDVLQAAVDQCADKNYFNSGECAPLSASFSDKAPETRCSTQPEILEDVTMVTALPGNNPVDGAIVDPTDSQATSFSNSTSSSGSARSAKTNAPTSAPGAANEANSVAGEANTAAPAPKATESTASANIASCKTKKATSRRV